MNDTRTNRATTIALAAAVSVAIGSIGGAAAAVKLITGKQIKDSSLTSADIKNGSLLRKDFKAGQVPAGPAGPTGSSGPAGAAGTAGAAGAKGDIGPSKATGVVHDGAGPNLTTTDTAFATISNLEAGSYLLMGHINLFSTDASTSEIAGCRLRVNGGTQLIHNEAMVGGDGATHGSQDASLSLHATETFAATSTVTMTCSKAAATPAMGTNGIILTAIRLGSETHTAF